ncbi:MAG: glycosyltransferase [Parasphingorhabdus sp.]|uniref:glycosyltransferase family 2 protein n=1 Tax=Parasphingorhabdus sp. TaxID=2709688 RepID=UPI00300307F9
MTNNGHSLRVAVILASTGRPGNLATCIKHLKSQSKPPSAIVLSVVSDKDFPNCPEILNGVQCVKGPKGSSAQRNTGLRELPNEHDVVAFFDDDYIPSHYCIENIGRFFKSAPDVIGANGFLIADGINSSGISTDAAEQMISAYDASSVYDEAIVKDLTGLYGCNMAYRTSAIEDARFDERLKLYGWQEDIDFAAQLLERGRIVKTHAFAGVHQGVKGARTSGIRLGYSQVINPIYLARKGTMQWSYAFKIITRNILANHAKSMRPEPWVDRIGRVKGNWLGIVDALRGRFTPERIEQL